jgi:hypothetical protein
MDIQTVPNVSGYAAAGLERKSEDEIRDDGDHWVVDALGPHVGERFREGADRLFGYYLTPSLARSGLDRINSLEFVSKVKEHRRRDARRVSKNGVNE